MFYGRTIPFNDISSMFLLAGGARTERYKIVDKLYEYGSGGHKSGNDLQLNARVKNEYGKTGCGPKKMVGRINFFEIFLFCTTI